jgi:hypothetical protein
MNYSLSFPVLLLFREVERRLRDVGKNPTSFFGYHA